MNASDIMTSDVFTARPENSVSEVALTMLERRISGLPVVDDARHVIGIVSEGDLIRRPEIDTDRVSLGWLGLFLSDTDHARDYVKSHGSTVREVMTQPAICVDVATPLAEVVQLMQRRRIKRLPVLRHGVLAGMVSRADLLRALVARRIEAPANSSDQDLRDRIVAALRAEGWAASAIVNVRVENGVAELWGMVESETQREALIVAARTVPGVKSVLPHLVREMAG